MSIQSVNSTRAAAPTVQENKRVPVPPTPAQKVMEAYGSIKQNAWKGWEGAKGIVAKALNRPSAGTPSEAPKADPWNKDKSLIQFKQWAITSVKGLPEAVAPYWEATKVKAYQARRWAITSEQEAALAKRVSDSIEPYKQAALTALEESKHAYQYPNPQHGVAQKIDVVIRPWLPKALPEDPLSIDRNNFLQANKPEANLQLLANLRPDNIISSIATEAVFNTVPKGNYAKQGFACHEDYQTAVADEVLIKTAGYALIAATVGTIFKMGSCVANSGLDRDVAYTHCVQEAGDAWASPAWSLTLLGFGTSLAIGAYAHHRGWLGSLLTDPWGSWRHRSLQESYSAAASTLVEQTRTALKAGDTARVTELQTTARQILENCPLIQTHLKVELQLNEEEAADLIKRLQWGCETALGEK